MPTYRVTLIYNLHGQGWTETYYRAAQSARAASDLGDPDVWLAPRAIGTELLAYRAQETEGLRRVFVRPIHRQRTSGAAADVAAVSARLWLPFAGGGGRNLWCRGLADVQTIREADGRDRPGSDLTAALEQLGRQVRQLQLAGRRLIGRETIGWDEVLELGPVEGQPMLTRVRSRRGSPAPPGQPVYFAGTPQLHPLRERGYLVWTAAGPGEWWSILSPWPAQLAGYYPSGGFRVRAQSYIYPLLLDPEFKDFTKHTTQGAYRPMSWTPLRTSQAVLNPCGRITDYGRRAYRVGMRLFADDPTAEVMVEWYFVSADGGRQGVPYEHPFASRDWDLATEYPTWLGEVFHPRQWVRGKPPVSLDGIGLCGSLQQWMEGARLDDLTRTVNPFTGQPCCCGRGGLVLAGGAGAGGHVGAAVAAVLGGGTGIGGRLGLPVIRQLAGGVGGGGGARKVVTAQLAGGVGGGGELAEPVPPGGPATCGGMAPTEFTARVLYDGSCAFNTPPTVDFSWNGVDRWQCITDHDYGGVSNTNLWYLREIPGDIILHTFSDGEQEWVADVACPDFELSAFGFPFWCGAPGFQVLYP